MRSKIILATVVAGALAAPLTALADSDSYGSQSPSAGASVNSGTSAQGSLGTHGPSAGSASPDGNDRYAQNDDHDNGEHRGRDKHRDNDDRSGAQTPGDSPSEQGSSGGNDQYAQKDGDSTLSNTPGDPSSSPNGSKGDASMRRARGNS